MSEDLASLFLALGIFLVGFVSIGPNIMAVIRVCGSRWASVSGPVSGRS
ncbi:hypothetical protein [Labrenzia sp. OB1]|nr:hypothetical protein [Labrenzia sp. OB1]